MTPFWWAAIFGTTPILAAVVIGWSCCVMAKRDGTLGGGR